MRTLKVWSRPRSDQVFQVAPFITLCYYWAMNKTQVEATIQAWRNMSDEEKWQLIAAAEVTAA